MYFRFRGFTVCDVVFFTHFLYYTANPLNGKVKVNA
ncbi:hypothetical protein 2204_scaffold211_00013 [Bacteriophage sp.]|nr:hypothetical protein 2204_scaffold211_00013 [Bacteriophage sp.]